MTSPLGVCSQGVPTASTEDREHPFPGPVGERVCTMTDEKERLEAQKLLREKMTAVQRFFDEHGGAGNPDLTQDEARDSWKLVEQLHVATNRWLELNR